MKITQKSNLSSLPIKSVSLSFSSKTTHLRKNKNIAIAVSILVSPVPAVYLSRVLF
jgi:hypothetical protein